MVAPEIIKTKDPFFEKIDDKQVRRKPPPNTSEQQRQLWKKMIKRAWYHDRNFCNCLPIDLGLGMIPIVTILPLIGPWICYTMHGELIKIAADAGAPKKLLAKMGGNVTFDFLISICPVLGSIFCWMNACSTKNAALFDTWMRNQALTQQGRAKTSTTIDAAFQQDHQARLDSRTNTGVSPDQPTRRPTNLEDAQARDLAMRMNQQNSAASQPPQRPPPAAQSQTQPRSQPRSMPSNQPRPQASAPPVPQHGHPPRSQPRSQPQMYPRSNVPQPQFRPAPGQAQPVYGNPYANAPGAYSGPPQSLEQAQARDLAMRMAQRNTTAPRSQSPHREPYQQPGSSNDDLEAALALSRAENERQQQEQLARDRELQQAVQQSMQEQADPELEAALAASRADSRPAPGSLQMPSPY